MVVIGNEPAANCLLGACATNRNESAATPTWTQQEMADADALGRRLVQAATALKPLHPHHRWVYTSLDPSKFVLM